MGLKSEIKRIFCIGPIGFIVTLVFWCGAFALDKVLSFPKMNINPAFKIVLITIFAVDVLYLSIGSVFVLQPKNRGIKLITNGPYKYIRHPLYSVLIYSLSGILAVWYESWIFLVLVLPLSFFWTWLVQKEENYMVDIFGEKYRLYQTRTGQFLPSWEALKKETEKTS